MTSRKVIDASTLVAQAEWSRQTFGPGYRPGTLKHLEEEIEEIREDTSDVEEYADALILILDDAMRAGHAPQDIIDAYHAKRLKNSVRLWPDWLTVSVDEPINHIRTSGCGDLKANRPIVTQPEYVETQYPEIWTCSECGSLVLNRGWHDQWHATGLAR